MAMARDRELDNNFGYDAPLPWDPYTAAAPPEGYHYDQQGNLVPNSVQTAPPSDANAYQGFESQWAPGASAPSNAPEGAVWNNNLARYVPKQADPVIGPPVLPPPPPGGRVEGGESGLPGSISAMFAPPAERFDQGGWSGSMPQFRAPAYKPPPAFVEPDYEAALKEPGYQFEANEGMRRLEQSRAAAGVLNGGGTLKDINAWGQNYAATRVNDVRNRARDTYLLNYATQYTDPYKYAYQAALDSFTGGLSGWQTQGQMGQRQNETDWLHAYTPFNDLWNRQIQVALA